ncbi:MAG: type II CRISPR-associated endonuclease Cas1 [Desulfovibrio sp.]|jgi:CRISPR-associated protein Cas1|nr:type II CRISPR-associated endonuclease Cas1 [Desulfovibrio sp.]
MSWRGLHFSSPARLRLKHFALNVERKDAQEESFALEDINWLILESPQVTITSALLAACAANGCLIVTCDETHMPNGMLLPWNSHYRQHTILSAQLNLTEPRKKNIWREIIQRKIRNQAGCLRRIGCDAATANAVALLERRVKSGDADNTEALAARLHWAAYALDFKRDVDGEDRLNALLNYAYALVRAAISRELAVLGFLPALGLHHKNQLNAFNLADDLLEPWRPLADFFVHDIWRIENVNKTFDVDDRRRVCGLLGSKVFLSNGHYDFLSAVSLYVGSVRDVFCGLSRVISFPDFSR